MTRVTDFIRRIRNVVGDGPRALHEPVLGFREREVVDECLKSGFVSSVGAFVTQFEKSLADYTGARHVVAMSSGTAALHVALMVAGVRTGDEVLIPSATFVATANAVMYCGAVPHFVDIEWKTLGLNPQTLEDRLSQIAVRSGQELINKLTSRRLSACVVMHTFGHPVEMEGIKEVAQRWGLPVVEDAAEALGSTRSGQHCGTLADIGVLSFNGNKVVTTGGGGAVLTNNDSFAVRARHLSTTAKISHPWEFVHDEVGFNYRMPNLNAALGCAQMERLPEMLASKRALTHSYMASFRDLPIGELFTEPENCSSNYWLQAVVLNEQSSAMKDELLIEANASGLQLRPLWRPLHTLAPYTTMPRAPLPVTDQLASRLINLPSSAYIK